jgi:hypothetical protein
MRSPLDITHKIASDGHVVEASLGTNTGYLREKVRAGQAENTQPRALVRFFVYRRC